MPQSGGTLRAGSPLTSSLSLTYIVLANSNTWRGQGRLLWGTKKANILQGSLKDTSFSTKTMGNHHLQGNVQVNNVRIPVISRCPESTTGMLNAPFFAEDLRPDPRQPQATGDLKVRGFSLGCWILDLQLEGEHRHFLTTYPANVQLLWGQRDR